MFDVAGQMLDMPGHFLEAILSKFFGLPPSLTRLVLCFKSRSA